MIKIHQKIRVLVIISVISLALLPLQTSAFFGIASTQEIRTSSLFSFVGEGFISFSKTYEINNQESGLNFFSANYLIASYNTEASKKNISVNKEIWTTITAYSSTKDQTDDTPFITALGTHVRDGVIAANFLPFGTVLKIPELYGDKAFVVEDRMNSRYGHGRIDIWFPERSIAKEFGVKRVKIEIIS